MTPFRSTSPPQSQQTRSVCRGVALTDCRRWANMWATTPSGWP